MWILDSMGPNNRYVNLTNPQKLRVARLLGFPGGSLMKILALGAKDGSSTLFFLKCVVLGGVFTLDLRFTRPMP